MSGRCVESSPKYAAEDRFAQFAVGGGHFGAEEGDGVDADGLVGVQAAEGFQDFAIVAEGAIGQEIDQLGTLAHRLAESGQRVGLRCGGDRIEEGFGADGIFSARPDLLRRVLDPAARQD